jgi:hypothetical protein
MDLIEIIQPQGLVHKARLKLAIYEADYGVVDLDEERQCAI